MAELTQEQIDAEVARFKALFAEVRTIVEAEEKDRLAKLEEAAKATEEARIVELVTQRMKADADALPAKVAAVIAAEAETAKAEAAKAAAAAQSAPVVEPAPLAPATVEPTVEPAAEEATEEAAEPTPTA